MITLPSPTQIWIAAGVTDLRRGFNGLSALVQSKLEKSPLSGQVFIFRGRRGGGSTGTGYVYFASVWSAGSLSGHKLRKELFLSHGRSYRCC